MSDSDNKAVVERFFQLLNERDYDTAEELLDDEMIWWNAGDPDRFFLAGSRTKEEALAGLRGNAEMAPGGMICVPTGWVVEGDKVAMEATVDGKFFNGDRYVNEFHFLIELRNGKILLIKEYFDTQTCNDVFTKVIEDFNAANTEA